MDSRTDLPPRGRTCDPGTSRRGQRLACVLLMLGALLAGTHAQVADPPPPVPAKEPPPSEELIGQMMGLIEELRNASTTPAALLGTQSTESSADEQATAEPAATPTFASPAATSAPGELDVAVTETGLLDVHVQNEDIGNVLRMLSYEAQANVVATNSVHGAISANLYSVTLEQALDAILTPNKYAYVVVDNLIYVGRPEEIADMQPAPPPPETRVIRLHYVSPREAAMAVKAVLTPEAVIVEGGGEASSSANETSMEAAGNDYIIVTDYTPNLDAAEEVLAAIDVRPQQVLIEATVVRATLTEGNQFGIDFTMLGGVDFQDVGSTSDASANLTLGQLPADDLQSTTFHISSALAGDIPAGGFTFGLIKDSIAGFIRALEEVTDVVVVANPKIIALNKQEAEVTVGRRDGYITTTVTETAAVQTVQFLETGTQIRFRPVINSDGTVRLSVHPKDSNGGLSAANLPFEETTEAHANILLQDGNTVLIGGLFRERTVNGQTQIPVLGNIPIAGLLFSSRNDQTVREEVIILLTVHVLKDTPEEQAYYRQLVEDVERIRVGARRGLVGTGRERLAQAFFHEAVAKLEEGDVDCAAFNLRMTINNQPKHLAAQKLLEQITRQRHWEEEGARMRTMIWELVQLEQRGAPGPVFDRPPTELDRLLPETEAHEEPSP